MTENPANSGSEDTPLHQPTCDEEFEQTKILYNQANISFDRFSSTIDKINSKILALFQTFLVLVTIQITIISIVGAEGNAFNCLDFLVLSWLGTVTIIAFFNFYYLVWPKNYEHLEMFEEDRFAQLCNVNKVDLLSDFLYYTRKSYNTNKKTYEKLRRGLFASLLLILFNLLLFGVFVIVYLML